MDNGYWILDIGNGIMDGFAYWMPPFFPLPLRYLCARVMGPPKRSWRFGESGGIERFQLASEFCAHQFPNASATFAQGSWGPRNARGVLGRAEAGGAAKRSIYNVCSLCMFLMDIMLDVYNGEDSSTTMRG